MIQKPKLLGIVQGKKVYKGTGMRGFGFWSNTLKNVGRKLLPTLTNVAKDLAPQVLTSLGNKVLEGASKQGAPDALVNLGSTLLQKAAAAVPKPQAEAPLSQEISKAGSDILQRLLAGRGVRNFGSGILVKEAPKI